MKYVAVILVVILALLTLAWLMQRRVIYFPSTAPVGELPGAVSVTLRASDGVELGGSLFAAVGADRRIGVLVANGNAGDRSMRAPLAEALAAEGLTVLLFDYRGYGGNAGSPSEAGLYRDVRAAYRHLAGVVPAERIILFGESLGCAMVTDLATEVTAGGLVLRSPFTDLAAAGAEHYPFLPVSLILRDRYPVKDKISRVSAPVVVVYGARDGVIPPAQSREVGERAGHLVRMAEVPGADHNDAVMLAGPAVVAAVLELADRLGAVSE